MDSTRLQIRDKCISIPYRLGVPTSAQLFVVHTNLRPVRRVKKSFFERKILRGFACASRSVKITKGLTHPSRWQSTCSGPSCRERSESANSITGAEHIYNQSLEGNGARILQNPSPDRPPRGHVAKGNFQIERPFATKQDKHLTRKT